MIKSNKPYISEQAMWGLGNIAADSVSLRDTVLVKNGMEVVIKAVEESQNATFLKMGAWTMANLMRGQPQPKFRLVKNAIPILCNLLMSGILNEEESAQCLWSISAHS